MRNKPIIITCGDPKSVFFEILFKTLKYRKLKSPIIIISSQKLININKKKYKFRKKINIIDINYINKNNLKKNTIYLINIKINLKNIYKKISESNKFIKKSFDVALNLMTSGVSDKFINGPITKKNFLKNKHPGITEYIAKRTNSQKFAMLIYNKNISVCPLTTHIPLKKVSKLITRKLITDKVSLINNFYKKYRNFKPKIAITGINPHCESIDKFNEDEKVIKPTVKYLKKLGYRISGPYAADTVFLKNNRKKFNVILGIYHDQVLSPLKTIYEFEAVNITLGLPFLRLSPDHGPNVSMVGKNISNPISLISAVNFLDNN